MSNESSSSPALTQEHLSLIRGSAIKPEVRDARGYRTITKKADLQRLGFGRDQQLVPTLLIPVWGVHGDEPITYQHRPDTPRQKKNKTLKYETPANSKMALDVPREVKPRLGDPTIPLFITEGARKANSGVSQGLCCIALLGVWNWRGSNDAGGKTVLPDWESIALNDRLVYIAYDSDVMTKSGVHKSLVRLMNFLASRSAKVKVIYLQPRSDGSKVGLDDFFAAGGTTEGLLRLAEGRVREQEGIKRAKQFSIAKDGSTLHHKMVGDELVTHC